MRQPAAIRVPDPAIQAGLRVAPTVERRSFFLRYDPALIIEGGLTHSGAALYAALSFLWFADVPPGPKLDELERKTGRKRFEPVEVTAQMLYPYTGLKGDGYSARMRELEKPRSCPFGRCDDPHPLITVRRLGQGRGLEVRRVACGEPLATRQRERVRRPAARSAEQIAFVSVENPPVPGSQINNEASSQNGVMPGSEGGNTPVLQSDDTVFQKPSAGRFLYGIDQKLQKDAAAAENAAAVLEDNNGEQYRLVLDLIRSHDRDVDESGARRLIHRLLEAIQRRGADPLTALRILLRAARSPGVVKADRPIAYLRQGILGTPPFLLEPKAAVVPPPIAPGLREEIERRVREGEVPSGRWLRDRGVDSGAIVPGFPGSTAPEPFLLCEAFERRDPGGFDREMWRIYSSLPLVGFANPKGYRHVIFFSRCRTLLEAELAASAATGRPEGTPQDPLVRDSE